MKRLPTACQCTCCTQVCLAIAYVLVMVLVLRPTLHYLDSRLFAKGVQLETNRFYFCGLMILLIGSGAHWHALNAC